MEPICQACGYQRKPTDQAPDWECPACGKAYTKTSHDSHEVVPSYIHRYPSESGSPLVKAVPYQESPDGFTMFICMSSCAFVALLGAFFTYAPSDTQWLITAVALVVPWIALIVAYARRNTLLEELGGYSSFILCVSSCFLMIGVNSTAAINSQAFAVSVDPVIKSLGLEVTMSWPKGILLAIPFGLACAAVVRVLDKKKSQQCALVVWPLLIVVSNVYGGALLLSVNRWFDYSSPTVHETTVIRKYVSRVHWNRAGDSLNYVAQLEPWGSIPDGNFILVNHSDYVAMTPGQTVVCIAAHPGALGMAWGGPVPCAEQASVER